MIADLRRRPVERVLRGRRVVLPDGVRSAAIHITGGRIIAIKQWGDVPPGAEVVEAGDALVFPGLVDTHVHINEPGRTEWEGFATATRAAAAGGVTTLLDMPLNSIPPTTSAEALDAKRAAAAGQCTVDVGFLGGVVPGNTAELARLHRAGVFGFKGFLCPSGVEEFPPLTVEALRQAMAALAELGAVLMVHAELPPPAGSSGDDPGRYATWLASRPPDLEVEAARLLVALAQETRARVHVVHVSAPATAEVIEGARRAGVRISAETCPHYLGFTADEIPFGATEYKCAPPIRGAGSREGLWQALERGALDAVVSDHSPAPPELKRRDEGDFLRAWGGIASLQLRLPAVWTAARSRRHGVDQVAHWLCGGPARLVGLERHKGVIRPGADADLVLWHPEEEFVVTEDLLRHRHRLTPWLGRRLAGVVEATYLRGECIYRRGMPDGPPRGRLLHRGDA